MSIPRFEDQRKHEEYWIERWAEALVSCQLYYVV